MSVDASPQSLAALKRKLLWRPLVCVLLGCLGIALREIHPSLPPLLSLFIFGSGVVTAAFLLAWGAEVLQLDISSGLATAVLAFIAVLPEYAVDFYFTWHAAKSPEYAQLAAANMTGANRLLIGVGWSLVVLLSTMAWRRSKTMREANDPRTYSVPLAPSHSIEVIVLAIATLWSLLMPLTGKIAPWHGLGMLLIFGFYIWRIRGKEEAEPELAGVAFLMGRLPVTMRRLTVTGMLLFSGIVLLACSKPFAEGLLDSGRQFHIDQFLLAQWLAPLASEAPELLVAVIFSLRGHGQAGLAALLSSKVNQWTLLVGTLPFVYSLSLHKLAALPLGARQTEELVLTAAQGLLGVAVLSNGKMKRWEALVMLVLFLIQLPFPDPRIRYGMSILYTVLAIGVFFRTRRSLKQHLKYVFSRN